MSDNPSQHDANKVVRVLSGKPLKYTVRVHKPDGSILEYQSVGKPVVEFHNEARALWLRESDYGSFVMAWQDGSILLVEENPA